MTTGSTFAHAYLLIGSACGSLGEGNARLEAYRKAKEHAAGTPEKERLHIEALYAALVEKDADPDRPELAEARKRLAGLGTQGQEEDEKQAGGEFLRPGVSGDAQRVIGRGDGLPPGNTSKIIRSQSNILLQQTYIYAKG